MKAIITTIAISITTSFSAFSQNTHESGVHPGFTEQPNKAETSVDTTTHVTDSTAVVSNNLTGDEKAAAVAGTITVVAIGAALVTTGVIIIRSIGRSVNKSMNNGINSLLGNG